MPRVQVDGDDPVSEATMLRGPLSPTATERTDVRSARSQRSLAERDHRSLDERSASEASGVWSAASPTSAAYGDLDRARARWSQMRQDGGRPTSPAGARLERSATWAVGSRDGGSVASRKDWLSDAPSGLAGLEAKAPVELLRPGQEKQLSAARVKSLDPEEWTQSSIKADMAFLRSELRQLRATYGAWRGRVKLLGAVEWFAFRCVEAEQARSRACLQQQFEAWRQGVKDRADMKRLQRVLACRDRTAIRTMRLVDRLCHPRVRRPALAQRLFERWRGWIRSKRARNLHTIAARKLAFSRVAGMTGLCLARALGNWRVATQISVLEAKNALRKHALQSLKGARARWGNELFGVHDYHWMLTVLRAWASYWRKNAARRETVHACDARLTGLQEDTVKTIFRKWRAIPEADKRIRLQAKQRLYRAIASWRWVIRLRFGQLAYARLLTVWSERREAMVIEWCLRACWEAWRRRRTSQRAQQLEWAQLGRQRKEQAQAQLQVQRQADMAYRLRTLEGDLARSRMLLPEHGSVCG